MVRTFIPSSWGAEGERYFTKLLQTLQTTSTFPPAAILLVCTSCKPPYTILERKMMTMPSGKNPRIRIWNLKICWAKTCQLGPLYTITC